MTEGGVDADVLTDGRRESTGRTRRLRPPRPTSSSWASRWHRFTPAQRRSFSVVGGLALLGAALGVQSFVQRPPTMPVLTFAAQDVGYTGASMHLEDPSVAADATAISFALTVTVPTGAARVTVSRLTGPGIRSANLVPPLVTGSVPQATTVNAVVDCTALTGQLRANDVRARAEVSEGGRSAEADLLLGPAGQVWAATVNRLCSAHLAARFLSVTQVTGIVDATEPKVDLTLVVRNDGPRGGRISIVPEAETNVTATSVDTVVPAGRSIAVNTRLDLARCPSWDPTRSPSDTTQTPLRLLATVSPDAGADGTDRITSSSYGPLPLQPVAAEKLKSLLVQACGGVASPVLLSQQPHASFDRATRILTTRLDAYLPAEVVRRVRFQRSASTTYPTLIPFLDNEWVTPDAAGVASSEIRFRVPLGTPCFGGGPAVTLDLDAEIAPTEPGQPIRHAIFTLFAETFLFPADFAVACQS